MVSRGPLLAVLLQPRQFTSTAALAGTLMILLICCRPGSGSRARHSLWPHTVWSSRMAALRGDGEYLAGGAGPGNNQQQQQQQNSAGIFLPPPWGHSCCGPHSPQILVGWRAGLPQGLRINKGEMLWSWVVGLGPGVVIFTAPSPASGSGPQTIQNRAS